jgi:hypothetical protein
MKSAIWQIAGTLSALGLAACVASPPGPPPPWVLSGSPEAITLRWYPDETSVVAADQLAALHCQSWGRAALLASYTRDGSAEIGSYRCR